MKLSRYLEDDNIVVKLKGVVITDTKCFCPPMYAHSGYMVVDNGIAMGPRTHRSVPLSADGDFDMGSNLAVQTRVGLLTVASKPGRRSRLIETSAPREPQPEEYQHPMRHYAGDQGRFNNRRY